MGILYGTPEKIEYSHKRKALHPNLEEKAVAAHCDTLSFVRELKNKKHTHSILSFCPPAGMHYVCWSRYVRGFAYALRRTYNMLHGE